MKRLLTCAPLLMLATASQASSNDAWAKFQLDVAERCAAGSGLANVHIPEIVDFDDSLGKVATLVTGRASPRRGAPMAFMKKLCIFDKRSRRVWIDEARGWSAPNLR